MEQQPGIDKKAIAAILLCAAIWAIWMNTNYRRTQALALKKQQQLAATATSGGTIAIAGTSTGGTIAMSTGTPGAAVTPPPSLPSAPERTVRMETERAWLALSSVGARPVEADLKPDPKFDNEHALDGFFTAERGKTAALTPWFGDEDASRIPADARFATASTGTQVVFAWTGPDGFGLTRTWSAGETPHTLQLVETYANRTGADVTGRPGVIWATKEKKDAKTHDLMVPAAAAANRFFYDSPSADEDNEYGGAVDYVAVYNRYFAAIVAPVEPRFDGEDSVRFRRIDKDLVASLALGEKVTIPNGGTFTVRHEVYVGPKDYVTLRDMPRHFPWIMNWGQGQGIFWAFIGTLTKGLWYGLRWFHSIVGNWGIAIIMLTFVMRGLLWPLAARQMRMANEFAAKTAKLKPQIDRLREKYADDPMAMNRETMALYKQYGISPFSPLAGCLPLLAQLPIWWALYAVLNTSIDLYKAPFVLWIHDLSKPETLFTVGGFDFRLMPLALGAVTWVQMKITPQAGSDPVQQKMMMYMMPAMFTFFMWSLPAGLVVYIFTSTLMGIAQQYLLKRAMAPKDGPSGPNAELSGRTEAAR